MTWVTTGLGASRYDILDPKPSQLVPADISRSLSRINRFNGHGSQPINVAFHTMLVCRIILVEAGIVTPKQLVKGMSGRELRELNEELTREGSWANRLAKLAFLHDVPEAYLGDVPSPLKALMPEYRVLEAKLERMVHSTFGLDGVTDDDMALLKRADMISCLLERNLIFPDRTAQNRWSPEVEAMCPTDYDIHHLCAGIYGSEVSESWMNEHFLTLFPWLKGKGVVH